MSFVVFADGTANLSKEFLGEINLLPCNYTVDGEPCTYEGDVESFDGQAYYENLREGKDIKTSLLNAHLLATHFREALEQGKDALFVSMSSGISGTYQAALNAAEELKKEFPQRLIRIIDSRTCGFGAGLLAIRGEQMREEGLTAEDVADTLDKEVPHMCSYFTVDDLNFLKRTGRISGASANIATVLNIKPILFGTAEGRIEACQKVRGRKKAIEELAQKYAEKVVEARNQIVAITHGDCLEDAKALAEKIKAIAEPKVIAIVQHEPFSGAHVGPGMLGLFFYGSER